MPIPDLTQEEKEQLKAMVLNKLGQQGNANVSTIQNALPQIIAAKNSGLQGEAASNYENKVSITDSLKNIFAQSVDPYQAEIARSIAEKSTPLQNADLQQRLLQGLTAYYGSGSGVNRVDYGPLKALADTWTGSKLSASHTPPPSPEEKDIASLKMQEATAENATNLAKEHQAEAQGFLVNKLMQGSGLDLMSLLSSKLSAGTPPPIRPLASQLPDAAGFSKRWEAVNKDYREIEDNYSLANEILSDPTSSLSARLGILKNFLARVVAKEKGALAEGDITRIDPNSNIKTKAVELWNKYINPKVGLRDDELIKGYKEILLAGQAAAYKNRVKVYNHWANDVSKSHRLTVPEAQGYMGDLPTPPPPPAPPPPKSPMQLGIEAMQKLLKEGN